MDINAILNVIADIMGAIGVPTALGNNFLDFAEVSLMLLFFPIQLISNLFGG